MPGLGREGPDLIFSNCEWCKTRQCSKSSSLCSVHGQDLGPLRQLRVGCYVAVVFMGAFGYCDDLALLAPSRPAMQLMLEACEMFGIKNNLIFSTEVVVNSVFCPFTPLLIHPLLTHPPPHK